MSQHETKLRDACKVVGIVPEDVLKALQIAGMDLVVGPAKSPVKMERPLPCTMNGVEGMPRTFVYRVSLGHAYAFGIQQIGKDGSETWSWSTVPQGG